MSLKEQVYSVLLISAAEKFNRSIAALLPEGRYSPVHIADSAAAARRRKIRVNLVKIPPISKSASRSSGAPPERIFRQAVPGGGRHPEADGSFPRCGEAFRPFCRGNILILFN